MWERDTVLIVDDSKLNRTKLTNILSGEYGIIQAENGREALDILKKERENIIAIILDLIMPIMGGYEFLEEYRKEERYKNIPVIVTTAEEDKENEKKCLECGVWDFIPKSFDAEIIRFRVMNAIKRSKAHSLEHDPLTGLYNQQKFFLELRELLDDEPGKQFVFMRVDIERFKMINSFYGMEEGDTLICYLADTVRKVTTGLEDCVYGRITADVFAICFPYDAAKLKNMEDMINFRLKCYKANYYIESSIGIYIVENNAMEVSGIYGKATIAANRCKGNYMLSHVVYTKEMEDRLIREQKIINDMDRALEQEEFIVYFQPKYDLKGLKPSGAEALVRWQKPDGTMVSPGDFIPIFERNGFIIRLDYYVWEKVCQYIRKNLDAGKEVEPISVNISRVNLYNPKFLESLIDLVEKYKIPPRYLNLEITESAFSDNAKTLRDAVSYLHKSGFTIFMDDFGSGYSSLNVLKDIDLDVLKIDMKFLSQGPSDTRCEKILEAVINMAESLEMPVIAEGVEEEKQYALLQRLGCSFIQGYYFARPMPMADYDKLIAEEENQMSTN